MTAFICDFIQREKEEEKNATNNNGSFENFIDHCFSKLNKNHCFNYLRRERILKWLCFSNLNNFVRKVSSMNVIRLKFSFFPELCNGTVLARKYGIPFRLFCARHNLQCNILCYQRTKSKRIFKVCCSPFRRSSDWNIYWHF